MISRVREHGWLAYRLAVIRNPELSPVQCTRSEIVATLMHVLLLVAEEVSGKLPGLRRYSGRPRLRPSVADSR